MATLLAVDEHRAPVVRSIDPWPARMLLRWHGGNPLGRNIWILDDDTAVDEAPQAVYVNGVMTRDGEDRVVRFLQGGVSHEVNAAEVTILTASGFGGFVS